MSSTNVKTSSAVTYPSDTLGRTLIFNTNGWQLPENNTFYILIDAGNELCSSYTVLCVVNLNLFIDSCFCLKLSLQLCLSLAKRNAAVKQLTAIEMTNATNTIDSVIVSPKLFPGMYNV